MKLVFVFISFLIFGCRTIDAENSSQVLEAEEEPVGFGIRAMFLPDQPVLKNIGLLITSGTKQVDIAIYMIDTDSDSPLIQALEEPTTQQRIQTGDLKIRMIFEGSRSAEDTEQRSAKLESLGIDVRYLASGRKVHHKFALVDAGTDRASMVTGTANWTLGTEKSYTEAVVFLQDAPGVVQRYAEEFQLLWDASDEYGVAREEDDSDSERSYELEAGLQPYFNTKNFRISGTNLTIDPEAEGYALTRRIVAAIDSAGEEETIRVAMTRISLKPIYDALKRAAARGVTIKLALNQENYLAAEFRDEVSEPTNCDGQQAYEEECSIGDNFAYLLFKGDYSGANHVHVRIKYYNLDPRNFLGSQLHAKYIMIGSRELWVGSFNWSHSSEYRHIENVLQIDGASYPDLLTSFLDHHDYIFDLERRRYSYVMRNLSRNLERNRRIWCQFRPMSLTYSEIDRLLELPSVVSERVGRDLSFPDCAPQWASD